jgi:acyl-CoA thioester hydrolase
MEIRIYYEDTDAAGVVYHANYLKYLERSRTEYFRDRALLVTELAATGYVFPVVRMEMDFLSPAHHDDLLVVTTTPERVSGSSFRMHQQILRKFDGRLLVDAQVTLACIGPNLKARRIPVAVRERLTAEIGSNDGTH